MELITKRGSDKASELHRGTREIEAERRQQGCELPPKEDIPDLHQNEGGEDYEDQVVRERINVTLLPQIVPDSTMRQVE